MSAITSMLFPSPNTPDLGCFVRRKHDVQIEDGVQNIHVELNPSIDFYPSHHEVYFRVSCGRAADFQRCLVYLRSDLTIPPPILPNFPPDFILGGDFRPHPSDWQKFPTQAGERFYFFIGQHRNPQEGTWHSDALVAHSYDIYENGTLSTVRYDDTGVDRDLNDLVLEVAVVGRTSWLGVTEAIEQVHINEQVARSGFPAVGARRYRNGRRSAVRPKVSTPT